MYIFVDMMLKKMYYMCTFRQLRKNHEPKKPFHTLFTSNRFDAPAPVRDKQDVSKDGIGSTPWPAGTGYFC